MAKNTNNAFSRNRTVIAALIILIAVALLLIAGLAIAGLFTPDTPVPSVSSSPAEATAAVVVPTGNLNLDHAEEILSSMTLREKVYQLFIVYPEVLNAQTRLGENTQVLLVEKPVGGFVLSAASLETSEQVKKLCDDLQFITKIPLIISVDEEGGRVERLASELGTTDFDAMFDYRHDGVLVAYNNARTIAEDLRANGLNTNFAPVADVWSNPQNTVIGDRAYSDNFETAAELVAEAVKGYKDGGILCTLKHFPGHGDTTEDSHFGSAIVSKSLQELRENELLPFISGIEAGADMVMIGHLTVTTLSDEPATLSRAVVTGLLRDELSFDGVIITDGLAMGAISAYGDAELAVMAINAGIDILLGPRDLDTAANGILEAVNSGELSEMRIDESILRILLMKLNQGIIIPPTA